MCTRSKVSIQGIVDLLRLRRIREGGLYGLEIG